MSSSDYDPLRKITALIADVDLNQIQDEAFIDCLKEEIKAMKENTKELQKTYEELEKETESMTKTLGTLRENYKQNVASFQLKQKMRTNMMQLVEATEEKAKMWKKRTEETLKKFQEEYEEARKVRESLTPEYQEYKKWQETLFLDSIRLRMLEKKKEQLKKKQKLRKEVDRILFNQKIVKFAEQALAYYKRNEKKNSPAASAKDAVNDPVQSATVFVRSQTKIDYNEKDVNTREKMLSEIASRVEKSKKQWIPENIFPKIVKTQPKVQSLKRPSSVLENPNKKQNITSVDKNKSSEIIRKETPPPPPSPFVKPQPKSTTLEPTKTSSAFFKKLTTPAVTELEMGNISPYPYDNIEDRSSSGCEFNENQDVEFISSPNVSIRSTDEAYGMVFDNNIPSQFNFGIDTNAQQPNKKPMGFFSDPSAASTSFNMFS